MSRLKFHPSSFFAKAISFILSLLFSASAFSQSHLQSGFIAQEFIDVLQLEMTHHNKLHDSTSFQIPSNYKRVYRSPVVGLDNRFDFWLRDDSVGVISLRHTVSKISWTENLYSGMIKAEGALKLNDTTIFNYKLSDDKNAFVHHGWTIGLGYLAPIVTKLINEYHQKGIKEIMIVGHSQGATLAYLLRSYLEYAPETIVPKNMTYKVYCSGAPKPGNSFYANDFDFITRNGWAFRVVSTVDWVPSTPFSVQTVNDMYPVNPFAQRQAIMTKYKTSFLTRFYINHAVKEIDGKAKKTNTKHYKYFTKKTGQQVRQQLKGYESPIVENSNFYISAGSPIILKPDSLYYEKFKADDINVFIHHQFESYIYLTRLTYLSPNISK